MSFGLELRKRSGFFLKRLLVEFFGEHRFVQFFASFSDAAAEILKQILVLAQDFAKLLPLLFRQNALKRHPRWWWLHSPLGRRTAATRATFIRLSGASE